MKKFDLIKHPLKIINKPKVNKNGEIYEVEYIEKIRFNKTKSSIYLHIEIPDNILNNNNNIIENNEIKIIGKGNNLFTIKNPIGFKTFDNKEVQFEKLLNSFHNDETVDNLANFLLNEKRNNLNSSLFETYFPNMENKNQIFKNYDFINFETGKLPEKYNVYYKYNDTIPLKISDEYFNLFKSKNIERFNEYFNFLKEEINKKKIISSLLLINSNLPNDLQAHILKGFLPLVAYYVITGPWKKLWIEYGFDPKKDINMYKYQRIPIRKLGKYSQLTEFPELINEIEKSPLIYLKEECEYERGFIKEEGIELIKNFINEKFIIKTTFDEQSIENEPSDFEILL